MGDSVNISAILLLISAIFQIYRLTDKKRQIYAPLNFPLHFCCFIYLSTFIFYIVEYLKKGKGKTYEKKSHDVFNANDVSFCGRRNDC
ncbi:hypothetical protein CN315_24740 [Bacillus cereus]|nr:hypothetical protein B2J90_24130 [Bacillus cereus]PED53505.1 hypothetical protein CON50_20050 [Bacillus anthracis]PFT23626.1 hypothetical protein COK52_11565 [Bacillus thuringiensis]PEF44361.1 hypothetical protein CON22_22400 [Bacillus cereus]PET29029.1 hypothetical protein CN518_23105 [Bacillus anthracis]